jgi:hypothetical protein
MVDSRTRSAWLWGLAAAGLALRLAAVHAGRADAPHADFASFAGPALSLSHPYDTSFREPAFVWWLWLLGRLGVVAHAWVRAAGCLWFLPTFFLTADAARRVSDGRGAFVAAALYAFLPSQIHADALALRHGMEAFGVGLLVHSLLRSPALDAPGPWRRAAFAAALLGLTRVNHAAAAGLLLAGVSARARCWKPLLALLPMALLMLPHFENNRRKFGDPFQSVNMHSHWFQNLENIGKPGFPATFEDWQKDSFHKTDSFLIWRFEKGAGSLAKDLAAGTWSCLTVFYRSVYFAENLPAAAPWVLMFFYGLGFVAALTGFAGPPGRLVCGALLAFSLPYALVMHVFWAGRFFVPLTPLVLSLTAGGLVLPLRLFRRDETAPADPG